MRRADLEGTLGERAAEGARLLARAPVLLARARMMPPRSPRAAMRGAAALRHGAGLSAIVALHAAWHPARSAVIDEGGSLTFAELEDRSARIAAGVRELTGSGGRPRRLAIMCRNHAGLVEAIVAGSRLGWSLLLVNYELRGSQLAQILERERPDVFIHDAEFAELLAEAAAGLPRVIADGGADGGARSLGALARGPARARPSVREGGFLLLTSGTTGVPKGVPRKPGPLDGVSAIGAMNTFLERSSIRAGQAVFCGPPGFHMFGLGAIALGLGFGGGVILQRRFDAEAALAAIERNRAGAAMFVPAMLQRILELPDDVRRSYDISSARTVISGAAPLLPSLYEAFTAEYGDVLHNGYGTTEVGLAAVASPEDLRAAPGTVGRPPAGIPVRILDPDGRPVRTGEVGGLYVGGGMVTKSYSGGAAMKDRVGSLLNTGDLARADAAGRLFIEGRQDDMIVSGGENVFPGEVEDVLASHEAVADVAVIGVEDERFGQRLRAYVVLAAGAEAGEEELIEHVRDRLERYKTPREVVFIDEIPRNPTGKILRRELAAGKE